MASATDAEKALRATKGKENFQRLSRLLMCGGVRLLQEKFDSIHSPSDLPLTLDDTATRDKLNRAGLTAPQRKCLYPSPGTFGKSTDFDVTLLFKLFRTICNLTEPNTRWDNLPNNSDHSLEADLVRIKSYRNSVAHNSKMEITDDEFCTLWDEISEALLRIAGSMSAAKRDEWKEAIDTLLTAPLTTEAQRYVAELQLWYKDDKEVKDALEQIQQKMDNLEHLINILITLKSFSTSGQQIASSHLPMVATSPAAGASERMFPEPTNLEQPRSGGAEGTSEEHLQGEVPQDLPTERAIWRAIRAPKEALNRLLEYLKDTLGVGVVSDTEGSLLIKVTCSSLEILEGLWEDYSSGHLNEVIEQTLVTSDILEVLGLSDLKLQTTIKEEEYKKCKDFFFSEHQSYETSGNAEQEEKEEQKGEEIEKKETEEELLQLRNELMNYDFHNCPRIKKEAFQDLVVDDIDLIRVAVVGPTGAGKTSLLGTLQRALHEPQTATDPDLERLKDTFVLEEHYVQKKIRVVDTRGFCLRDEHLEEELLDIMFGRLRPGDEIVRSYDKEGGRSMAGRYSDLSEYVHTVIFVVDANDPHLMDGTYRKKLQNIRERLYQEGYAPVTAITFLDKLTPKEKEKDTAYKMAQRTTGSSGQTTFFITNYITREHDKISCEVDRAALDILDSALVSAERFIQFRMQREQNQLEKEVVVEGAPSDRETIQQFLTRVGKKHNWTDQGRIKAILKILMKTEIRIVKVFKALWEDTVGRQKLLSKLQLPIGMRKDLDEELKCP